MNADLLYPSKYIKCADLNGKDVTKTIKKVAIDTLVRQGGAKEKKPVIWFSDTEKILVMNRTNCKSIIAMYGKETDNWIGRKITLYPTKAMFGADEVDCVRVRVTKPETKAAEKFDEKTGEVIESDNKPNREPGE